MGRRVRRAALHDGPQARHVPVVLRRVRRGRGLPAPVPFDLFDPFGSLRKRMDTEEKRARGRLIEINNGRAAMLGIFGFMSASKVPGSVPVLTFIPPYDGNYMIPFEGNFHMPSMM